MRAELKLYGARVRNPHEKAHWIGALDDVKACEIALADATERAAEAKRLLEKQEVKA